MTLDKITTVVQAFGVLVAAVSWPVIYLFNLKRDREAKRRDLKIDYLIEAWRSLEYLVGRKEIDDRFRETIEKALATVQLFGTLTGQCGQPAIVKRSPQRVAQGIEVGGGVR